MRRHLGLMGMAAALALLGPPPRPEMPVYRPVLPPTKKAPKPVNARPNKTHRLKGLRS